ncbi:hypothetical protein WJX72_001262 [[Myrmecia] bisecta]|uniref:Ubiquitin carboxyl-terminal hydrolase n=1 Tax=[Myrmecia] bisecta TaxID=41462 RepID=A0AAW1P4I3_9CHLO
MSQRVTELLSTSGGTAALRRINFVPAQFPDAPSIPEGIDFIRLNDPLERPEEMAVKQPPQQLTPKKRPRELFRNEDVQLQWSSVRRMGAGLQNMGNTCFMNSVLQCLTHTPPLAEVLLSQRPLGLNNGVDVLRMTQQHVQRALQHRGGIVAPVAHARGLKRICRGFKLGRQEDAHEYLVAVLDAMHEGCLAGLPKLPPEVAHTSMIHRIFAGRMCSQVRCLECSFESNTFEPFFDISLDVTRAPSLVKALAHFVRADQLEGPNRYKCPKQQRMVRAEKSMRIERPPNVLVIQLKRFGWTNRGIKVSKQVEFETELDMSPFMRRRGPPQLYALYAVLVHAGHSTHCGHYYCYVRAPNGLWHCMDDTSVSQVSERVVLAQKAYILLSEAAAA